MPSAPCPAAGSIRAASKRARMRAARPEPHQPGGGEHDGVVARLRRACAAACRGCRAAARCAGRAAAPRSCTTRRRLEVPTTAPCGSSSSDGVARCETKASRGSSRSSTAASAKPAGRSIGTSFSECTARSRAAVLERGLQLLDEQALAADLRQRAVEDLVAARRHAAAARPATPKRALEQRAHMLGLPQREAALARGDDEAVECGIGRIMLAAGDASALASDRWSPMPRRTTPPQDAAAARRRRRGQEPAAGRRHPPARPHPRRRDPRAGRQGGLRAGRAGAPARRWPTG